MADIKISELTEANLPLDGTEDLPIVQDGVTKRVSTQDIADLATGLSFVKVTVTSSELLNLGSTSKQLLPAPGTGKINLPVRIVARSRPGASAYSSTSTYISYYNATTFQSASITTVSGVLLSSTTSVIYFYPSSPINNYQSFVEDAELRLTGASGSPTGGDGEIDIYIHYVTLTL